MDTGTESMGCRIIFKDGGERGLADRRTVIALGTFDGVHIAHRGLLECAVRLKGDIGAELCGAFCFYKSPISHLRGIDVPAICSFEQKVSLMFDAGLDFVAAADFSEFCDLDAKAFVCDILRRELGCTGAVCGFNHRFGKGGYGDPRLLCDILGQDNVITFPEVRSGGVTVSSTAIRKLLSSGDIAFANRMLGRPFSLKAPVIAGKRLGRRIGCPTANQVFPSNTVELKRGIYATLCTLADGEVYIGASNVGTRPSIDGSIDDHSLNCETLLSGFSGDIYGRVLKVEFYEYLRGEQRFESLTELSAAIKRDLENAESYFKANGILQ